MLSALALASWFLPASIAAPSTGSPDCESLAEQVKASVPELTSVSSALVSANSLNISSVFNSASFCRFNGTVPYPENNTVLFEVWLPESGSYNGRFLAVGNGGLAGTVDYAAMVLAWIRNSIALFTTPAKQVASLYYAEAPSHAYYKGCSTGGAQVFALAEYHPELFDGIVAGCPGNWYSHLALSFLWNQQVSLDSAFIPQETLTFIRDSILDKCDTLDGVADRVIENPLACSFDLSTLACTSSSTNTSSCLTPAQITAAEQIYAGPRHSQTNASLYPGFDLGSESEWINQEGRLSLSFSLPLLQNMVFDDLSYNGSTFDWAGDVQALDEKVGSLIDSISTNLTAFKGHGGKLIVTQGWADPYNAATWPIQHLEDVEKVTGDRKEWASLFMVPGKFSQFQAREKPRLIFLQEAVTVAALRRILKFPVSRVRSRRWLNGWRRGQHRLSCLGASRQMEAVGRGSFAPGHRRQSCLE
ncbi:hypothetical protein COL922a_011647 [Colletotrichum nupharicola]|nr:hypothetical protein COL922a_011647 [Colletotrichum nupharicola]